MTEVKVSFNGKSVGLVMVKYITNQPNVEYLAADNKILDCFDSSAVQNQIRF